MEIYCYNPGAREKASARLAKGIGTLTIARKTSYILQPIYGLVVLIFKVWWLWGPGVLRSGGMENQATPQPPPPLTAPQVSALGSCWLGVQMEVLLPVFFLFREAGATLPRHRAYTELNPQT